MAIVAPKPSQQDQIAGALLITAGFAGLIVRLGFFNVESIPELADIQRWWPLLLIVVGAALWLADNIHNGDDKGEGERRFVIREMTYGK